MNENEKYYKESAVNCAKCRRCGNRTYLDSGFYCCGYILKYKKRRGCPAGAECTRFEPGTPYQDVDEKRITLTQNAVKYARMMSLYKAGNTDLEIATKMGLNSWTIKDWRKKMKLPANRRTRHSFDYDEAEKLYRQGMNDADIGRKLGVSKAAIWNWRNKRGMPANV